ncbi:hypothetical protein [Phyllobacterium salinisoli]|uniref:hypothetical protein n=1 Tax=Phyllobacterium salinisoli TaxID=1899321 RepID=UPI0011C02CA8|nr:hypothetical protein [Phyllobacterium salinisoli]
MTRTGNIRPTVGRAGRASDTAGRFENVGLDQGRGSARRQIQRSRSPAGEVRRLIVNGAFEIRGDASNTVDAMIETADSDHPPLQLALGSTANENIRAALTLTGSARRPTSLASSADQKED